VKRYRYSNFYIDCTRAPFRLGDIHPSIRRDEIIQLRDEVAFRYGELDALNKASRYLEFDPPNFCIISEYLDLLHAVADAYVHGDAYPALTGACSLGERIFNILILRLRKYYTTHSSYRDIHNKDSFQDWEKAIDILSSWGIIDNEVEKKYRELAILRNQSIHFGNIQDTGSLALAALKTVMLITDKLFGLKRNIYFWCPGEIYVKKEYEDDPFVKEFIIPKCVLVGFKHEVEGSAGENGLDMKYIDDNNYPNEQISDTEFRKYREDWRNNKQKGKRKE
jgi:hypothetical protein